MTIFINQKTLLLKNMHVEKIRDNSKKINTVTFNNHIQFQNVCN